MKKLISRKSIGLLAAIAAVGLSGCRTGMPHSLTWPAGGDITPTHAKPPEGGYYTDWDPYSAQLEVTPIKDVNPVRTQHIMIATVKDAQGRPLPNRRVEWIISEGSVGDIVEVDESGWRNSRGYKVDNHYAVTHTNNFDHVLNDDNDDPSDDIPLTIGQTWCVITSPIEGDTHVVVYAPGIYDWDKHKVFVTKHWYDVAWEFPPPGVNPIGTDHEFTTRVTKFSDGTPLPGYIVTYRLLDGPAGTLDPGGAQTATVKTDDSGMATVRLRQSTPMEGTNNLEIDIVRPEDKACCKPAAHIATGQTSKTWLGPKIAIAKDCTPQAMVGETFTYNIMVTNPSQIEAQNVTVTDALPDGVTYVSSTPSAQSGGQMLTWSLGSLPGGGSSQITVQVQASRTGQFDNCADVTAAHNLNARDCCTTVVVAPELVLEKTCTPEVTVCDTINYTIRVTNRGSGVATNVQINDPLPDGLVSSDGQRTVTSNIGSLGAGETREVSFSVKPERMGTYHNTARAMADGGLSAEASCTTVVTQPVLEVTKTGPNVRYIGRTVEYDLTVSNRGDTPAVNTVLVDVVPDGTEFVSATGNGQLSGGRVTWDLGTLAPGASRNVQMTLRAVRSGVARNTAQATAICAQASAEASTDIQGIPAILLETIDIEDPIEVGTTTTYVITVTNQGSAPGTNIRVEATLPDQMSYVSGSGDTPGTATGQVINFAPVPNLAPGAKATFRVVARGERPGDVRFKVVMNSDQITTSVQETEATNVYE